MYKPLIKLLTFLADFLFINLGFAAIFWLRFHSGYLTDSFDPEKTLTDYTSPMLILFVYWFILFFFAGLYRNWTKESRFDQAVAVVKTIAVGIFLIFLLTGWEQILALGKTRDWHVLLTTTKSAILSQYAVSLCIFAVLDRILVDSFLKSLLVRGIGSENVLVIGANDSGRDLRKELENFPALGHRVVGFVDDDSRKTGSEMDGIPVMGKYSDLPELCNAKRIGSVIISRVSSSPNEIMKIIQYCSVTNVTVHMQPDLMDVIKGHVKTHQLYGFPLLILLPEHMPPWQATIKRIMDIGISFGTIILGLPFWILVAVWVKLDSKGSSLYAQERVGRNGRLFTLYKFRTMITDAEKHSGPVWAGKDDPRITRVGRILRKTRLDEIPQFFNVLKGEMSLVGPRPERKFFVDQLKAEIPLYARRMKMKPGITGWAQVKHHYDTSMEDVQMKILFDLYYFENMSLMLDLKIILQSFWVVVSGKGAR